SSLIPVPSAHAGLVFRSSMVYNVIRCQQGWGGERRGARRGRVVPSVRPPGSASDRRRVAGAPTGAGDLPQAPGGDRGDPGGARGQRAVLRERGHGPTGADHHGGTDAGGPYNRGPDRADAPAGRVAAGHRVRGEHARQRKVRTELMDADEFVLGEDVTEAAR